MVKQLECYTKKKKDGGKYTTCTEGQKKKKRTRRTKAQMKASKAMGMEDKPAPKVKAKPKAKAKATKKMSAGKSVLFTSGLMAKIGKARKGLIRNYTAKQIKDIVDNNILKLYQAKVLTENTIGENLEAILEDSMANEAENSYWGDDEKTWYFVTPLVVWVYSVPKIKFWPKIVPKTRKIAENKKMGKNHWGIMPRRGRMLRYEWGIMPRGVSL